jgi:hypothetical protein
MAPRGNERPQPQLVDSNAKLSPPVRESLGSAVATHGVQMRVSAAPYKGTGKEAMIALTIETSAAELGLTPAGDTLAGELEVGFLSIDVRNKVTPGNFHLVKLALQNARGAAAGRTVRVIEEARLAPGRYQVRAALGNRAGKSGSVVYDLQVPDFAKAPLVMSGVALTSELAGRAVTVRGKEPLKDLLPGPPTAAREFSTADVITLYTEVYDNLRPAAGHTVRIAAELRAEGGQAVRTVTDERTSKDLDGSRGGYGFTAEFPLVGVEPGRYVIHVEARADTGDRPEVARDILVTIR